MLSARNVQIPSPRQRPRLMPARGGNQAATNKAIFFLYLLVLGGVSIHLYRRPVYDVDAIQYMGNALLMEETDIGIIHKRVYADVQRSVPQHERQSLLGEEPGAPEAQNKSRQGRAASASRYAEFLPLFAIRPLYNQTLWLVSKSGLGLVRSGILISVGSYFLLGILVFVWLGRYASRMFTLAVSILLMISPPLANMGRDPTPDALATLVALGALYLIFEKRRIVPGMALLLASIYFRTDFVVLAGPTILACWLEQRIDFWKAGALALVAVASVLCINHFAGDYGIEMLYYRAFVGTPIAPAEMTAQFSFVDYLSAFRRGITLVTNSFFLPFLLLGMIGAISPRVRTLFAVALAYAGLHFVILPSWEERYYGLFYVAMGVCATVAAGTRERSPSTGDIEKHCGLVESPEVG
jgi:hypothetical protein